MSQTIFLSTVTGEFGTVRQKLAAMFGKTKRIHVRHQDDFVDRLHHGRRLRREEAGLPLLRIERTRLAPHRSQL